MVQLLGWIALDVTEDPINAPSYAIGAHGVMNDEGGLLPRNGFEVQFSQNCAGFAMPPSFSVMGVHVFTDYVDTVLKPAKPVCLPTAQGKLHHFQITVSQSHIEVRATAPSNDGKTFDPLTLLYSTDLTMPFTRGYVQLVTHNHASLKYSNQMIDAWVSRWDNVGFDGFTITDWREYEVADALTPGMNAWNRMGPVVSIGYRVADVSKGPAQTLHLHGVDLTGAMSARLSLSAYYLAQNVDPTTFVLKYRFNGKAWRDRPLTSAEVGILTGGNSNWTLGEMIDVDLSDLVQGDNTLEFVTSGAPQNYPPAVANIDLVVRTH
jgi:hypothetical protein